MVVNETINQTFEVAQGSIQYSPPPAAGLNTTLWLMVAFFVVIMIVYIRIQKAKKSKKL
jgi:hypothetical protein